MPLPEGMKPEKFVVFYGWLAYDTGEHNCVGGPEAGGVHEAHCGLEPLATLDQVYDALHKRLPTVKISHEQGVGTNETVDVLRDEETGVEVMLSELVDNYNRLARREL